MSFGFSLSDFLEVIDRARQTYDNYRKAPKEFHEACREISSLYAILEALEDEVKDEKSPLLRTEESQQHFKEIITGCGEVLTELYSISVKYGTLGTENAKLLHRLRFPHKTVDELRRKLTYHTNTLSTFLETVGLGTLGRVEKRLEYAEQQTLKVHETLECTSSSVVRIEQSLERSEKVHTQMGSKLEDAANERREILKAVHDLGSEFRAGAKGNSTLSARTDDGM